MSPHTNPSNHCISHTLLVRKVALLTKAYDHVLNEFTAAVVERNSPEEAVDIINHYADQLKYFGKFEEAKRLYWRAIDDLAENFGRGHVSTVATVFKMGTLLHHLHELERAEELFSQAISEMEDQQPYKLLFLHGLGVVYAEQRKLSLAEKVLSKSLCGFTKKWGGNNMHVYITAIHLGEVYHFQGRRKNAASMLRRGLLGVAREFGMSHDMITANAPKLKKVYEECRKYGKLGEAREICYMVLDTFETIFGLEHLEAQHVVLDLADMLKSNPVSWED